MIIGQSTPVKLSWNLQISRFRFHVDPPLCIQHGRHSIWSLCSFPHSKQFKPWKQKPWNYAGPLQYEIKIGHKWRKTLHSLELTYQYHLQQLTWFDLGSYGRYSPSSDTHDKSWPPQINFVYMPIESMYGMFAYIWLILMVNLGKYTIVPSRCYSINRHASDLLQALSSGLQESRKIQHRGLESKKNM